MIDFDTLTHQLHKRWGPDVAQETLVVLLSRPVCPEDPEAFCRSVAWRLTQRREWRNRKGKLTTLHTLLDPQGRELLDETFGWYEAPQHRRVEAREELESLDPLDLARGLGYLDPPPQEPRKLVVTERERFNRARAYLKRRKQR